MRRTHAVLLAAIALAGGCIRESNIEPIRETVMVHGMMRVGSSSVGIAIAHVSTSGAATPLNGATVRVRRGDVETTLVQATSASSYCFAPSADAGAAQCYAGSLGTPIESGETIGLTIELADGTHIVGSTVAPSPPAVEEPSAGADIVVEFVIEPIGSGFSLEQSPIEVRWSGTDGRPADVHLVGDRLFDDGAEVDCGDDVIIDQIEHTRSPAHVTAPLHCTTTFEDPAWDSAYVTLHVVAYDDNALDYFAAIDDQGAGVVLDGASPGLEVVSGDELVSGVLGATAHETRSFTLRGVVIDPR